MELSIDDLRERGSAFFPGFVGIEFDSVDDGVAHAHLELREEHLAPNGYLHAGAIVTLADTTCGYGCFLTLPEGAVGFTTIELKTNFLRTALDGAIVCEARRVHAGRTTQLWDATVSDEAGRPLALFRCTQLLLRGD
jgi:1,4-dihydroxy-2-naphthoyl-CoA hydrolase